MLFLYSDSRVVEVTSQNLLSVTSRGFDPPRTSVFDFSFRVVKVFNYCLSEITPVVLV